MLIDWFTLVAQAINFLVLVWLLKRFLYKPILNAIDEREKRIVMQMQDAENLKEEAIAERDIYQQKNKEFDQQRQELLVSAINEADSERRKLLEQTREEIENLRTQLQENIRNEQQNLSYQIRYRTQAEVFSIARKVLADLASVSLESQMAEVFIQKINELSPDEKELLLSAINKAKGEIIVRCTFLLPGKQQNRIADYFKHNLHNNTKVQFETAPNQVNGIELIASGYKVVWSIDEYLTLLEKNIDEFLSVKT